MQTSQLAGNKRPAPGTVPSAPLMQTSAATAAIMAGSNDPDPSDLTNDQFLAWGGAGNAMQNDSTQQGNQFGAWTMPQKRDASHTSNQLIRRNQNNQLATPDQTYDDMDGDEWHGLTGQLNGAWNGDNGRLSEKAEKAKQEALSKRPPKHIPPFIQKLTSFLDNVKYEDLIRWSSTGDSFVVLDEEQFANRLIPELFKHKNYASFVRQLNMYGFHKRVGLTDNSMRASERKARSPSEYENAYFKKGRPELLWLIAKPRSSKKRKGQEDGSDDEEVQDDQQESSGPTGVKKLDLVSLPRSQLATFQSEIQQLQRQQQHINNMIARFQHENTQYIRQASERHERHENSINAILQFLATFYSRNADNSGNIPNMFGGNLPNPQPSGNVQEVNDFDDYQHVPPSRRPQQRRPLALLPAPEVSEDLRSVTPEAASSRPISSQDQQQTTPRPSSQANPKPLNHRTHQPGSSLRNSSGTFDKAPQMTAESTPEATTPKQAPVIAQATGQERSQSEQQPPQESQPPQKPQIQSSNSEIMRLINNSNAASPNLNLDFTSALKNYENASPNGPLTPEQRNNVLSLMANTSGAETPMSNSLLANANLTGQHDYMGQYAANQDQLDMLKRMQQDQDSRVQNLAGRLQPLSPHGSIPGLENTNSNGLQGIDNFNLNPAYGGDVQNDAFNIDNWLNSDYVDNGPGNDANLGPGDQDMSNTLSFDDANNNYFGNINPDGGNMQTTTGAEDVKGAELFNTSGQDANDLFGDLGDGGAEEGEQGGLLFPDSIRPAAAEENSSEGGKVIGSVGTSSAGLSPNLEAVEDEEEGGRRKRQRRS